MRIRPTHSPCSPPCLTEPAAVRFSQPRDHLQSSLNDVVSSSLHPLSGVSLSTTVLYNETGKFLVYTSDRHGFHNPDHTWDLEGPFIVAVGDSFTHGAAVQSHENAIAVIRLSHPATLNLGCSGNGPLIYLATLREYVPHIKTGTVLWFHFEGNDFVNLQVESKTRLLRYLDSNYSQELWRKQDEIDHYLRQRAQRFERTAAPTVSQDNIPLSFTGLAKLTRSRNWLIRSVDMASGPQGDFGQPVDQLFQDVLRSALDLSERQGFRLVFVYLPQYERFSGPNHFSASDHRNAVLSLVEHLGVQTVDLTEDFEAHDDPLSLFPFRMNGHYNAAGYRLVAETILASLETIEPLADTIDAH